MPSRFVITEITGSQRSIELGGWAGPRRGPSWGITMNTKKTTYAGNDRASIQVLGPSYDDSMFNGRWTDRYLVNGQAVVQATGFPDLSSSPWAATDLVAAFYDICKRGNALRVEWANEVREGILKHFLPRYSVPTGMDVEWEMQFEWGSADSAQPSQTAAPVSQEPRSEMRQEVQRTDQAASRRPGAANAAASGASAAGQRAGRAAAGICFDAFATIGRSLSRGQPPSELTAPVNAVVSATGTLADAFEQTWHTLADVPIVTLTESEQLVDRMLTAAWRLDLYAAEAQLRDGCLRRAVDAAKRLEPGRLLFVTAAAGQSLRVIAGRFYGNQDAWQKIADVNEIAGVLVPRSMVLVVPITGG